MSKIFTLQTRSIKAAQQEKWEDALALNQELLEIEPRNVSALNRMGFAYLQLQKLAPAKKTYRQVLEIDASNNVAKKYLKIIENKKPVKLPKALSHTNFIDEPGKTKSTKLSRPADLQTIESLSVGSDCQLEAKKTRVSVFCDGTYIGSLPDDLTNRVKNLLELGHQLNVKIQSLKNNKVKVFIRETMRGEGYEHIPSFPTESGSLLNLDSAEIARDEEAPVYMEATEEEFGSKELDSGTIEEALRKGDTPGGEEDLDPDELED